MVDTRLLALPGAFQSYFDHHPDGMCVVDAEGNFFGANAAAYRIFGYRSHELTQTAFGELLDRCGILGGVGESTSREAERTVPHQEGRLVPVRVTRVPLVTDGTVMGTLITLQDITTQSEQRKELAELETLFAFIAEHSQNIISSFSAEGIFTYVSPNVHALLGYSPDEVIGQPAFAFNPPETNEALRQLRQSQPAMRDKERFTGRLRHKNGQLRWYETTLQYLRDPAGSIIQTIGVGRDITDRKEAEEKIEYLAYHDALTDLPNRRLFRKQVRGILAESGAARHLLMLLDLDGFKQVNDMLGHDIGDALLIAVAQRLTQTVGTSGIVARLGGDEFTIFYENVGSQAHASTLIDQIKGITSEPIVVEDHALHLTASIGVSCFPEDGDTLETLMRTADVAMYSEKQR